MPFKLSLCLATIAAVAVVPLAASAQESAGGDEPAATPASEGPTQVHSVNVSPLGLLFGSYSVNYEHLLAGYHGFVVEGSYSSGSNDDGENADFGGALGYRLHWSGSQDSGFVGVSGFYNKGVSTVTVTSNGASTSFDVDYTSVGAVANIGRRWAWDSGFNITLRFGAGYASRDFSTDSETAGASEAVELTENLLELIPVTLDGEFSAGWAF